MAAQRWPRREAPVLVTGANSGIGLATALHLAGLGFPTIGTVRTRAKVDLLLDAARAADVEVEPLVLDVTDPDACERALAGRQLYGLVNNAGYYNVGAVDEVPRSDASRQVETMVVAPMHLARLALPAMRARGRGRIVNVSSAITHVSGALTGWYQASKQGLAAVTDALRMEVRSAGIEVVLIEPGGIRTEIWRKAEDDLLRRRPDSSYATAYDRALALLHALEQAMAPPTAVAEAIGRALTAPRPRSHYRVGPGAGLLRAGRLVPEAVRDRVIRTVLGL